METEVSDVLLLDQYVAISDYKKKNKGEISVTAGMVVEIVEKQDSGWWFANAEGNQGWVPATFLEPVDTESASDGIEVVPENKSKHITLQKYTALEPDEVSFEKSAIVVVKEKRMDGWWKVEHNGKSGWAPGSYLKTAAVQTYKPVVLGSQGAAKSVGAQGSPAAEPPKPAPPGADGVVTRRKVDTVKIPPERRTSVAARSEDGIAAAIRAKKAKASGGGGGGSADAGAADGPGRPRRPSVETVINSSYHVTKAAFTKEDDSGISFPAGAEVEVMERDTGTGWTYILYKGLEGWAPSDYLEAAGAAAKTAPPPVPAAPKAGSRATASKLKAAPAVPAAPTKPKAAPAVPAAPAKPKAAPAVPAAPAKPAAPKPTVPSLPKKKASVSSKAAPPPVPALPSKPAKPGKMASAGSNTGFKNVLEQAQAKMVAKNNAPPKPAAPAKPAAPKPSSGSRPPKPAAPQTSMNHTAIADYKAETDAETSLTKGMPLNAGETADGWTMVTTETGAEGWVPSDCKVKTSCTRRPQEAIRFVKV
jgi:uncharacterized protein YgiM (DUF1202 family)